MAIKIQIAPHKEDCRIEGHKVIGTMNGKTMVFYIPMNYAMPKKPEEREAMISNFREAIALASRSYQVEAVLNRAWGIEGGKFSIQD